MSKKIIFEIMQSKDYLNINATIKPDYLDYSESLHGIQEKIVNTSNNHIERIQDNNSYREECATRINNQIINTEMTNIEFRPAHNSEREENNIFQSTEPFEIISPIEFQCNNSKSFYSYHLKSLLIFLIYLIVIKFLQNIFKGYCFAKNGCDCSDNSIIIKIWTMILTQHYIGHIIWIVYLSLLQLREYMKYQLVISSLVCIILAFFLYGQSQILVELRLFGAGINLIVHFIIGILFMKKINKVWYFLKTSIAKIIFIFIFTSVTVNYVRNIKEILNNFGDSADVLFALYITIMRILYKLIFSRLVKNINQIDNEHIYEEYIITSDILWMPIFGFEIGIMFQGKEITWNYYFYLFLSQITSIKLQTNILENLRIRLYIFIGTLFRIKKLKQYSPIQNKNLAEKIMASRKIIYTGLAYINLFLFYFTQEWMEYYDNNTSGCFRGIPDYILTQINSSKSLIFILANSIIDIACYYYNKKNNFDNVIFCISKRNYISFGISFYISSQFLEAIFQKSFFIF